MTRWAWVLVCSGYLFAGCAEEVPPPDAPRESFQADWVAVLTGEVGRSAADLCTTDVVEPAEIFHARAFSDGSIGVMVMNGAGEADACLVAEGSIVERTALAVEKADLAGSPRYVPGEIEPDFSNKRPVRSRDGVTIGWVYWP